MSGNGKVMLSRCFECTCVCLFIKMAVQNKNYRIVVHIETDRQR